MKKVMLILLSMFAFSALNAAAVTSESGAGASSNPPSSQGTSGSTDDKGMGDSSNMDKSTTSSPDDKGMGDSSNMDKSTTSSPDSSSPKP